MQGENPAQHFFYGRFAVAAGQREGRHVESLAPETGDSAEGDAGILNDDLRQRNTHDPVLNHRCQGSLCLSLGEICMPIEVIAFEGHEQGAGTERARVGGHTRQFNIPCDRESVQHPGNVRQFHRKAAGHERPPRHAVRASRATSTSLK